MNFVTLVFLCFSFFAKADTYKVTPEQIAERRALVEKAKKWQEERENCEEFESEVVKVPGGCKITSNNMVYGTSLTTVDSLMNDGWLDRSAAQSACRRSNAGGHRNWRLPTDQEILDAAPYYAYLGQDPYLYYWTDVLWSSTETIKKSKDLPNKTIERRVEERLVGYDVSYDYYRYDTRLHSKTEPVFGTKVTTREEVNRRLDADFDFNVENMKLVRPSLAVTFQQKIYSEGDRRGTIHYKLRETVSEPLVNEESYDTYAGQSWGHRTKEVARIESSRELGSGTHSVDPRDYLEVVKPSDIRKNQIGLFCVREEN